MDKAVSNITMIPPLAFVWPRLILLAFMGLFIAAPASASTVEASLPSGTVVSADFRPGEAGMPAVILIHGFLQTRDFPTVAHLADGLSDAGYTTLSPTLSLGISNRNKSLPCEAIHQHSMEQDVSEIGFWTDWLVAHHFKNIILVGHSYGSLQSVIYGTGHPNPALRQIIAISLTDADFHPGGGISNKVLIKHLKEQLAKHSTQLEQFPLGYCKTYTSPPANALSYLKWDRAHILKALLRVRVPVTVILGNKDDRMGPDWPNVILKQGTKVKIVEGANHFFDDLNEFPLLDLTLSTIKEHLKVH